MCTTVNWPAGRLLPLYLVFTYSSRVKTKSHHVTKPAAARALEFWLVDRI